MSDTPIQDNIEANGGKYVGDEVMRFHKRVIPLLACLKACGCDESELE